MIVAARRNDPVFALEEQVGVQLGAADVGFQHRPPFESIAVVTLAGTLDGGMHGHVDIVLAPGQHDAVADTQVRRGDGPAAIARSSI